MKLIEALHVLINRDDAVQEFDQQLDRNISKALKLLGINNNEALFKLIPNLEGHQDYSIRWKYIYLLFYILLSIKDDDESMTNVRYLTNLKKSLQFIVSLGVLPNLIAGVGIDIKQRGKHIVDLPKEALTVTQQYYRLTGTTHLLLRCLQTHTLHTYIITNHLNDLLGSLLQICYAKLKKPDQNDSVMSPQFYNEIMADRSVFQPHLNALLVKTHAPQLLQELMFFYGNPKSPKWLKIAVLKILNTKLLDNGVESLVQAMIGQESLDIGTKWRQCDIIAKLIMTKSTQPPYYTNVCEQLIGLLAKTNYEYVVAACMLCLFENSEQLCFELLLQPIMTRFVQLSKFANITHEIQPIVNVLHLCTCDIRQIIPSQVLTPVINNIFNVYLEIQNIVKFGDMSDKLTQVIIKYINDSDNKTQIFDSLLFETNESNERNRSSSRSAAFIDVINASSNNTIIIPLFLYLLELVINSPSNSELLVFERKLVAYDILATLVASPKVQTHLKHDPQIILNFINAALINLVETGVHRTGDYDSDQFQMLFLLVMVISVLHKKDVGELRELLNEIATETTNTELKLLILSTKKQKHKCSEYEKAIEDICDPFLPVRGHGLMTLAKLLETNDREASANKQFILNLCLQQLKNEDSYIYLNAIRVLSALGTTYPDIIINNLTDEYSTECLDHETRMKVGEVLLRVVQTLGDVAPKYKSVLLNTFLSGVRDEDHLIRASSLSNLGELCRVLGFKLGSIVSEVLACIHAVIATDAALEARRAAISVIRSLFIGLRKDMILYLKDDIRPIYKTLRDVYMSDPDHIIRLQAQLALEELNANMRDFLFPNVQLSKSDLKLQ